MASNIRTPGSPFDGWKGKQRENCPSKYVGFCHKHFPDGLIHNLNVYLCVNGDKQVQRVDGFKSYSPVMHWTTIQLILIIVIVLNWTTVQTDYTNALAQAPLSKEIYMEIPKRLHSLQC